MDPYVRIRELEEEIRQIQSDYKAVLNASWKFEEDMQQLRQENQQLRQENQQLRQENQNLRQEKNRGATFENIVSDPQPLGPYIISDDPPPSLPLPPTASQTLPPKPPMVMYSSPGTRDRENKRPREGLDVQLEEVVSVVELVSYLSKNGKAQVPKGTLAEHIRSQFPKMIPHWRDVVSMAIHDKYLHLTQDPTKSQGNYEYVEMSDKGQAMLQVQGLTMLGSSQSSSSQQPPPAGLAVARTGSVVDKGLALVVRAVADLGDGAIPLQEVIAALRNNHKQSEPEDWIHRAVRGGYVRVNAEWIELAAPGKQLYVDMSKNLVKIEYTPSADLRKVLEIVAGMKSRYPNQEVPKGGVVDRIRQLYHWENDHWRNVIHEGVDHKFFGLKKMIGKGPNVRGRDTEFLELTEKGCAFIEP